MSQIEYPDDNALPSYGMPPSPPVMDAPREPARIGPMGRLVGVLFSPGETFADINRKPTWLFPMIVCAIFVFAFSVFLDRRIKPNYERQIRKQIVARAEKTGAQAPSGDVVDQQVAISVKITKVLVYASPIFVPIGWLILSGIFALGMLVLQAKTTFMKIFSVVGWTNCSVAIVSTVVKAASFMVRDPENFQDMDMRKLATISPTNLAAYLPSDSSPVVLSLASSLDLFTFWSIILLIIGLASIGGSKKIKTSTTATLILGLWLVWVLASAGIASVFG